MSRAVLPYHRADITPGIVHLGTGAFHRAHIATYIDQILAAGAQYRNWGIIGASLKRPDTRDALSPQDFLYNVMVRGPEQSSVRPIGSVLEVLDAVTQRDRLLAAMTHPDIRIVTLTVTEKGYCHDPATGHLDELHADIVHDLANPVRPVSAIGLLVRTLELRRAQGIGPYTILCCDNLAANGETTRRVVSRFAEMRSAELGAFVRDHVFFPSTMVDRIVPATTDEDRRMVYELTGSWDAWPVVTEPFTQWVVEDRFGAGRPPLEQVGVQMVADVRPYELMKLRMLNGSHSMIAYLGYLAGYQYVSDAIANPVLRKFIHDFMTDEAMPSLPQTLDRIAYREALLERFGNPSLKHRTWQIAMDGSQKLPQRLLGTIGDRLAAGGGFTRAALGVAAWIRYAGGTDDDGRSIDVKDPLADRFRDIAAAARGSWRSLMDGFLDIREVFDESLARNDTFVSVLSAQLRTLSTQGSIAAISSVSLASD